MLKSVIQKKDLFFEKFIRNFFCSKYMVFIISLFLMLSNCYLAFCVTLHKFIHTNLLKISIAIIVVYILNLKFSKFFLCFSIYIICAMLTSALGEYTTADNCLFYIPILAFSLYIEMAIRYNCEKSIKALAIVMFLLIFINFLTILLYPNGLYFEMYSSNWFLKYDNVHIFIYLPALVIFYISSYYDKSFFNGLLYIVIFIITFSVFYCFSVNSVIAYTLLMIYWIFEKKLSNLKILNCKTYFIMYILMFFGIEIFKAQYLFSWLLVDVLKKGLNLNNRVQLWEMVLLKIKKSPLIGYGSENGIRFSKVFGNKYYTHAHNTILDVLYKGGIILLICFFKLITVTLDKLNENKHLISKFIGFVLFCMFIMMNIEAREDKIGLYIVLVLGYNINYIVKSIENGSEKQMVKKICE